MATLRWLRLSSLALLLLLLSMQLALVAEAFFLLQQRLTPPPPLSVGRRAATISVVMAKAAPSTTDSEKHGSTPIGKLLFPSFRLFLPLLLGGAAPLQIAPALAAASAAAETATTATTTTAPPPAPAAAVAKEPTEAQLQAVRDAFRAFDGKDLAKAERLFDRSVKVRLDCDTSIHA